MEGEQVNRSLGGTYAVRIANFKVNMDKDSMNLYQTPEKKSRHYFQC